MKSPFVWGKNGEKLTPEDVERQRLASAMMYKQGADFSPAGHWSEALGRAFNGWASGRINKLAGKGEKEGLAGADERIAAILAGQGGGGGYTASTAGQGAPGVVAPGPVVDPAAALGDDAMAALGKPPVATGTDAASIRAGLVARGLPEHVADGFVMNFQDESGLNPGINEISPIVPGSRGGYGLYQLTGPRRRAYEAYAADRGIPLDSVDGQLDFLMTELQGPEARAASAIMSTKTPGEAGAAIVNEFLRPSPEYAAKRASEYLGGQPPTYDTASGAPAVPGGTGGMDIASLLALQSDPWVAKKYGGVVDALMGQQFSRQNALWEQEQKMADPMYQAQLAELTAPKPVDPFAGTKEIGGVLYGPDGQGGFVPLITPPSDGAVPLTDPAERAKWGIPPTDTRPYAVKPGEVPKVVGGDGVTVNNNMGGGPEMGKLSTDFGYVIDPETNLPKIDPVTGLPTAAPVPGSPAWIEAQRLAAKGERKDNQTQLKLGTTLESINLNLGEIENGGLPVTGVIGDARRTWVGRALTGDSAVDFGNRTNQITDQAALSEVQNMRDNSPTGGAVGALTDNERVAIGNSVTAINSSTSPEEYARAAKAYRKLALDIAYGEGTWTLDQTGQPILAAPAASPPAEETPADAAPVEPPPPKFRENPTIKETATRSGLTVEELWENMSPAARAKFGG